MKVKKILVSQPQPENDKSPYFELAARHSLQIDFKPFIKVQGLTASEFRKQKIYLQDYTAIIFTSKNAVDHFFRLCEECATPFRKR
jgi:uroporphyrinogen-III synthase